MALFPKRDELTWAWLKKKLLKHFLPLGFLLALILALAWPTPGDEISSWKVGTFRVVQTINVCTIFVISGLTLKTEDIISAITAYRSLTYGLIAILIITPALGFAIIEIPFEPKEFAKGLAIFAAVPTTLTSGVALVAQAQGNAALALMLTVCSNLLGILTVPFTINLIISSAGDTNIDTIELLLKLLFTILIPLIIGKGLRELSSRVQQFVKAQKTTLSLVSNGSLIFIVWQTLSRSQEDLLDQRFTDILIVIVAGVAMHLIYLAWNSFATMLLQLPLREKKAVLIMASQKTLPVSVTVIGYLDEMVVGNHGLLTVPCIVAHMAQLFIDAVIVSRWATEAEKEELLVVKVDDKDTFRDKGVTSSGSDPTSVVSNPLDDLGQDTDRDSSPRLLHGDEDGEANQTDRNRGPDGPKECRPPEAEGGEACSESDSYASVQTPVSTSIFFTNQETRSTADVPLPPSRTAVSSDVEGQTR